MESIKSFYWGTNGSNNATVTFMCVGFYSNIDFLFQTPKFMFVGVKQVAYMWATMVSKSGAM